MSFKNKIVEFVIKGRDLFSGVAQNAEEKAAGLENTIEILNAELANTEAQQKAVARYQELSQTLDKTKDSYTKNNLELDKLKQQKVSLSAESKKLSKELSTAKTELGKLENASKQAGDESEELERSISEQRTKVDSLAASYQKSVTKLSDHELALKQQRQSVNKLSSTITKGRSEFERLGKSLKRQRIDLDNLSEANNKLATKQRFAQKAISDTNAKLSKQQKLLERTSKSAEDYGGSVTSVTRDIVALGAAYIGIDQLTTSISNIFTTGDKFERLGVQMTGLMGSIAGGEQATEWIKEFTKSTPLQLSEVSEAFVKLKAFGIDPTDGAMQAIVDTAFKLGGSFEQVEGISLALGQAWSKQKLQGEEILQLIERGVPVWDLLQNVTGKNVQELQKLSSAGKLGRDVISDLMDEMGRDSAGSAAAQMQLLSGQVSNAKDNLDQFYNLIAQSGAMDWLKQQLTDLNKEFAAMAADGRLKAWAQSISDTIVSTGESIKSGIGTLIEYKDAILTVTKVWLALKVGTYFSNVIAGSRNAISALALYLTSLKTVDTQTKVNTASSLRFKGVLTSIGAVSAYTLLLDQLANVYVQYQKLLGMERDVTVSKQKADEQASKLADTYAQISRELGINITTMAEFDEALRQGLVVQNEQTGAYESVINKQKELETTTKANNLAEQERQAFLQMSIPQALDVVKSLDAQSASLSGVRDGVDGFILSLNSAREALSLSEEKYADQIAHIDDLKLKFEAHNKSLERQAYLSGDLSKAYQELGLTSSEALTKTAEKLQGAFELIQQHNQPIAAQQQAFLKWADAAINAADATDQTVPSSVEAAAAALGLTTELDKLIAKANELKPVTDTNSEAVSKYQRAVEQTNKAIRTNQQVIASSTATSQQKAEAQKALSAQQVRLTQQTQDLNKVQGLELATLGQLKGEQGALLNQLDKLGAQYQSGAIQSREYNQEKGRLEGLLRVVNQLLGDFKGAQDAATQATQRGTQATKESTKANELQLKSLRDQKNALDSVSRSASSASSNVSSLNNGPRPTVQTIVDYQEKHEKDNAYSFSSREVRAEKERRAREQAQAAQYDKFESQINSATSASDLKDLYTRIVKQLNYLDQEQRGVLSALIKQRRDNLKQSSNISSSTQRADQSSTSSVEYIPAYQPQQSSTQAFPATGKTIRLQVISSDEVVENALVVMEDRLIDKLEQLRLVQ
ncbi:tape measure protein [Pseudoalteromonas luteoviolacea]|uniref:tape measure protein n=1 Tax=Pseudoalteromonas luteoviolacea TaxID=43657 RepID=UPI001B37504D|nr:tape measure protein [Pseudoalteromonas luteoviolacea]MBQ4836039.1 tape measure protein [Pseudoalteromonas luteoviolacea]